MFDPLFEGLAWLLAVFYDLLDELVGRNAYALSIAMLTLTIMIVFTPLTIKGTRSMMQMSTLQPEIKRLQAAHRGDRQKLNEEMMKLYQAHGVSPLGGCLPTLIQIPVFFVLYRVISGLTQLDANGNFDPKYLSADSQLRLDLQADSEMRSFGMDLARSANDVLRESFVDALPYLALVLVTFGLAWFQQRQLKARRTGSVSPNRQTEMLMKVLPFMLPVFSFLVQAALAVYFVTSSLYRIAQQAYIHRTLNPAPVEPESASLIKPEEPPALKGGSAKALGPKQGGPKQGGQAATVSEPPQVSNERSQKALNADQQRLAERAARSASRRSAGSDGSGSGDTANIGIARVAKPPRDVSQGTGAKSGNGKPGNNKSGKGKQGNSKQGSTKSGSNKSAKGQPNGVSAAAATTADTATTDAGAVAATDAASVTEAAESGNGIAADPAVPAARKGLRSMLSRGGRTNANGKPGNGRAGNGRAGNGKSKSDDSSAAKPIQSRRTSGDGRSRKRR